MATTVTGRANGTNGRLEKRGNDRKGERSWRDAGRQDEKTDRTRWRMKNDGGVHTWHYLSEEEAARWPMSRADKWYLGMDTGAPTLPPPKTPLQAATNGFSFFSALQLPPGNWGCEYGGPMFLLPGLVITWYVTETPIPTSHAIEIKNYIFARQHPVDGGWGLHIEGESSVFGTAMNYTVLRLLGVDAEDPRLVKARETLWKLGGALNGPHWAKFWLSVLGVLHWDVVNPCPPELWLLPDWVPVAPWRWWIHMRQVFQPMSFIYSRRWSYPLNDLTRELRKELVPEPFDSINFDARRNTIAPTDNYHPKTWILRVLFWFLAWIWFPLLRTEGLKRRAEEHVWWLIEREDENTDYANLGPVNGPMNTLVSYIKLGPDSVPFKEHLKTLPEFLWMNKEGMLMNGTNGVQVWDTAFTIQAANDCGFTADPKWHKTLTKALEFLEDHQIRAECREQAKCYRQQRKGAWGFSNRKQGYTVSDCTSEGLKSVLILQKHPSGAYPQLVPDERLKDAIDVLLTMQNPSGGCASYEPTRGSELLEYLNAAEVFGKIMVEYDYPECTTAVITGLHLFQKYYPDYRTEEIRRFKERAINYIRRAQRPDGSWYGAWGICFTYATWFALESLACAGETYANSERVRRACLFLLGHQMEDGGWGETYRSCEIGEWCQHEKSQVVQTAWALVGLLEAEYPEKEPIKKGIRLIMERQQANGEWLQEAIEGVFNKSCMISYPNYKFIFTIKALGMYAKRFGDEEIL
ncbi:lanosterol synthase [Westerdykella ornata]|uniref:Terpene cyclase/mutase family member n=1 Tax=Westerdykella ornata TaxID=318751 RepID=A0A6A6JEK0_WESOR|nr:lanosterol synthase [Westerdykella ornata]KAF2274408.1 lanosterol synthase [Westerdykella ornata]